MTQILAHRANLTGPDPVRENSHGATLAALAAGFGIETDLRRENGRFYIAHDASAWSGENDFARFDEAFRAHSGCAIALNVKELGYERDLVDLQASGALGARSFLFDFELLEPEAPGRAQRLIRRLPGGDRATLAARLSDRGESLAQCLSIPAEVVWLDEFDSPWISAREIEALHAAGRRLYAVSPELHGADDTARLRRWADFRAWGVEGVCTDYALAARDFFAASTP